MIVLGGLFSENLIKKILVDWLNGKSYGNVENKKKLVKKFEKWTTYFVGFHENRKNVYSSDEIPTSIIYRIVHDNLPKFLDNVSKFDKLKEYFDEGLDFGTIKEDLKDELDGKELDEIFSLKNFNSCLNQSGIDKFNFIIGGKHAEGEKEKRKGVNEYINLFSQKKGDKSIKSLKMTVLFKQILSDRESASFVLDKFENDKQVIDSIKLFYEDLSKKDVFKSVKKSLEDLKGNNLEQVYVKNDKSLTDISQFFFKDYSYVENALRCYCEEVKFPFKNKEKPTKKEIKVIDDYIKKTKYFSVFELEESIRKYNETLDEKKIGKDNVICCYFSNFKKSIQNKEVNVLEDVKSSYEEVKEILRKEYSDNEKDLIKKSCEEDVGKMKSFLDSIQNLFRFVKPLYVSLRKKDEEKQGDVYEKDSGFYEEFDKQFEELERIISLYNRVRNYITQKSYSVEKFKLNFENPTLADGWDLNKETDYTAILFRRGGLFYLGVMDKNHNKLFENVEEASGDDFYEKMIYKQISDASKDVPNLMVINRRTQRKTGIKNITLESKNKFDELEQLRIEYRDFTGEEPESIENLKLENLKNKYLPSKINDIRRKKSYLKSSDNFDKDDLNLFIDYYKERLDYWNFDFDLKPTEEYLDFNDFTNRIGSQGYKLSFQKIDRSYVDELVEERKLYLFQIYSKDFSTKKKEKGTDNLHTLYWKSLFDEDNLRDVVYKLNGKAELFYRKKSIDREVTHPKNLPIENKDPIDNKKESKFGYDLIKNRRFTEDKFLFHCPISLNFKARSNSGINDKVNSNIKKNLEEVHVLGIDRGERHLAYHTLLNSKGEIVEQESFNIIKSSVEGTDREVNYQEKLGEKEKERDKARKSWETIKNIKEMKEGYLSQVVHRIAKLIIEKNAIVVFEDLNSGFKRERFKIEKQVYQKLEKMLIDKLNYLIFKDRDNSKSGGLLKAYQLVPPSEKLSFRNLRGQLGVIFYVPSYYTSKICPRTGFVNLLYLKHETIEKSREFFKSFRSIRYNAQKGYFEFEFNYKDFKGKGVKNAFDKDWVVCSFGERLVNKRNNINKWETKTINVTEKLEKLFRENGIEFENGDELKDEICNKEEGKFFKSLIYYLKIVLQVRNSESGTDKDYFLSCVADKDGRFFNSENYKKEDNPKFPKDADSNGAYNVGLKGLMILDKIKSLKEGKKLDLKIDNKEFFEFVLGKVGDRS